MRNLQRHDLQQHIAGATNDLDLCVFDYLY